MTTRRAALKLIPGVPGTIACSASGGAAIAVIDVDPRESSAWVGDDEIAALSDLVDVQCRAATAAYESAYQAVAALNPGHVGRFDHPVTRLDEAAIARYSMGVAEGLRLGLMVGMARGLKQAVAAQQGEMPPYHA